MLDGGATMATPGVERSNDARAVSAAYAVDLALATPLTEATRVLRHVTRATLTPMLAEAALVLVCALCPMLRQSTPELKNATPPSNARGKRRNPRSG